MSPRHAAGPDRPSSGTRTGWQRGQALVLALLLTAAAGAMLFHAFEGGQRVRAKVGLASAADAAAYSGALVQARGLNFLAYANRALVAHQVAMAHAITLASWARFGDEQARRVAMANPPATLIAGLFGPAFGAGYRAAAGARGMGAMADWQGGALARAFAEHDRVTREVLAQAQRGVLDGLAGSRDQAMRAVLDAHGAGYVLQSPLLGDTLPGAVVRYGGEARGRLKSMVDAAAGHYGFLAPRNHTAHALLPSEAYCPWLRHELRRRGDTAMEGWDAWRSVDTESFHALRSNRWIGCYYREYPMGGGAVRTARASPGGLDYVDDPPADFGAQDFWRWVAQYTDWNILTGSGNPLANSYALAAEARWKTGGLPGFPDLAATGDRRPVRVAIRVTQPDRPPAARGAGRFALHASLPGGQMAAVSAAETYYRRPEARPDGRAEAASLFMPYWQARLGSVTDLERAAAWAEQWK